MTTSTVARRRTAHHRPYPPPGRPPRAVLDLGAVPTAPGCARAWTRQVIWEWRLVGISDTADLIVTELTTNAVLISRQEGQPFIRAGVITGHIAERRLPAWAVQKAVSHKRRDSHVLLSWPVRPRLCRQVGQHRHNLRAGRLALETLAGNHHVDRGQRQRDDVIDAIGPLLPPGGLRRLDNRAEPQESSDPCGEGRLMRADTGLSCRVSIQQIRSVLVSGQAVAVPADRAARMLDARLPPLG